MKKIRLFLAVLLIIICTAAAVQGDAAVKLSNQPITKVDLGVTELTLERGESYTFNVSYIPENTANPFLRWYSNDERIISIDGPAFTVTALSPGNAVVYAESIDAVSSAVCHIRVNGSISKDAAESHSGSELIPLTEADRAKIGPGPLRSFTEFVSESRFSEGSLRKAADREFLLVADVIPGTEKAESQAAQSLGMISEPLENLNMITLQGTFEQLMTFAAGNTDLREIFGGEFYFADSPEPENSAESAVKSAESNSLGETITNVSIAHKMGYKGEGTTIAVIDTGINSNHEQFENRIIREKCFTSNMPKVTQDMTDYELIAVCEGGSTEADSSIPDKSFFPENAGIYGSFNHGSNVAGIAAGKDGIAPKANIVGIMIFSLGKRTCINADKKAETCYAPIETTADKYNAYNYILGLKKEGIRVDVVNMSYGDTTGYTEKGFSSVCDDIRPVDSRLFKKMVQEGIILAAAAGNSGFSDAVAHPACDSSVFSTGCVESSLVNKIPLISLFSNQSEKLVDIFAPGTHITSAAMFSKNGSVCRDCYTTMSGTSQASPMTAGAFLLLKQAVPGRTVEEYKQYLPSISRLSTDRRELITYPYPKKVLNFDGFPEFLNNIKGRIVPNQPFFPIYRLESAGVLPRTGISGRNLPLQAAALNYRNAGMTLQIPVLSLNTEIVEVPYLDGEYPVSELGEKAGLPEGFSLPGNGTTLLIGHNHLGTETAGPFALLYSLQSGDRLFVNTQQEGTLRYEVFANEKTAESDFSSLQRLAGSEENALLLLTCEDERPEGGYANRRIVAAKPVR